MTEEEFEDAIIARLPANLVERSGFSLTPARREGVRDISVGVAVEAPRDGDGRRIVGRTALRGDRCSTTVEMFAEWVTEWAESALPDKRKCPAE